MPIVVAGSIATDHLMHFPGRFTESLLPDQLERVSLSFLVDDLVVRRGGVAPNICYGMGLLGAGPILLGAVGADFGEYASWLQANGVITDHVLTCPDVQTARFVCTTDDDMNQIASFYSGAMARAVDIDLQSVVSAVGDVDLVMISAETPEAMVRYADTCRELGYRFAADPSQQLARMDGEQAGSLITGANLLFTNDYELGLLKSKTGWSDAEVLSKVGYRVTTHGARGVEVVAADGSSLSVPALPEKAKVDPTGVGDGFRSGFLAGQARGLSLERACQLGSLMATLVLETTGAQEYTLDPVSARGRLADAYGADAAAEIAAAVSW